MRKYIILAVIALFFAQNLYANNGKAFGLGKPELVAELPDSRLKTAINKLPEHAKAKALRQLQTVTFPEADVNNMSVGLDGSVLYIDDPVPVDAPSGEPALVQMDVDPSEVFYLHSNKGSNNVLYLDFDGADLTDTSWNSDRSLPLIAKAYDPSRDGPAFSQEELNYIYQIWQRVSEDFAPFNIDVTTELPDEPTASVLITSDRAEDGRCVYACGWGGFAWLGTFGTTNYTPALVYWNNVGNVVSGSAEVTSHEFGHSLSLAHDGDADSSYYSGHGSGYISWGPIMGNAGYYRNITQWSKGEYADATNQQDDLAIIESKLGYLPDDFPDTFDLAKPLPAEGVINSETDVDWFFVDVDEDGWLEIEVYPSWIEYDPELYSTTRNRGSNLDIELTVFDGVDLTVIDDPEDTDANIATTVTPGRYYIQVTGQDNVNMTQYNSMGKYVFIGGFYPGNQLPVPIIDRCPADASGVYAIYMFTGKGVEVVFDGTGSFDKDGEIVTYEWLDENDSVVSIDAVFRTTLNEGTHTFTLRVTDDDGDSFSSSTSVTVLKITGSKKRRAKRYQESCS